MKSAVASPSRWHRILYWRDRGFLLGGGGTLLAVEIGGWAGAVGFLLGMLACGVIIYWPRAER